MRYSLGWLVSIFLATATVYGEVQMPPLQEPVVDAAGMLSAGTRSYLANELRKLHTNGGSQIAVLTIPTLENESIEQFSIRAAESWKLGGAKSDNGVLVVIAAKERKVRIEVGQGLEGSLTDAYASRIIHEKMLPLFKDGDFDSGVISGVMFITQLTDPDAHFGSEKGQSRTPPKRRGGGIGFFPMMIIFALIGILQLLTSGFRTTGVYSHRTGGHQSGLVGVVFSAVLVADQVVGLQGAEVDSPVADLRGGGRMVREIPDWLAGRLDREGLAKIEQVVSEAETKTSGEIVPFLIKRCVRNAAAPYLLSLVVLLLLLSAKHTLFLLGYPIFHDLAWSVLIVVLVVIGYSLGHLHWFELRLMPHHERMRQVSERAMLEFYREHLDGTKGRTGILLFLSLAERRAVVLADESIAKYYGEDAFDAVVAEMISGAKSGDLAEGFSKAVVRSRELLTPYFPPEGSNPNELKDHLRIRSN